MIDLTKTCYFPVVVVVVVVVVVKVTVFVLKLLFSAVDKQHHSSSLSIY